MKEKFETSIYLGWFSENRTAYDQENIVAYGQEIASLHGANSRLISLKNIFTKCNIL